MLTIVLQRFSKKEVGAFRSNDCAVENYDRASVGSGNVEDSEYMDEEDADDFVGESITSCGPTSPNDFLPKGISKGALVISAPYPGTQTKSASSTVETEAVGRKSTMGEKFVVYIPAILFLIFALIHILSVGLRIGANRNSDCEIPGIGRNLVYSAAYFTFANVFISSFTAFAYSHSLAFTFPRSYSLRIRHRITRSYTLVSVLFGLGTLFFGTTSAPCVKSRYSSWMQSHLALVLTMYSMTAAIVALTTVKAIKKTSYSSKHFTLELYRKIAFDAFTVRVRVVIAMMIVTGLWLYFLARNVGRVVHTFSSQFSVLLLVYTAAHPLSTGIVFVIASERLLHMRTSHGRVSQHWGSCRRGHLDLNKRTDVLRDMKRKASRSTRKTFRYMDSLIGFRGKYFFLIAW